VTVNQWWYGPASYGRMLTSAADRERALDVLKAGYAEGRLTKAEHDTRAGQVHQARTYDDLAAATSDLPGAQSPLPAWPPPAMAWPPAPPPRTSPLAVSSLWLASMQFMTFGITGIPAVILGQLALRDIRRTGEGGTGLAAVGMVLGSIGSAFVLFVLIAVISIAVRN
jgi:hypothetical protein